MKSKEGYWTKRRRERLSNRKRKWIIFLLVPVLIIFLAAHLTLKKLARNIFSDLNSGHGIIAGSIHYSSSSAHLPLGLSWSKVVSVVDVSDLLNLPAPLLSSVNMKELSAYVSLFRPTQLNLAVQDLTASIVTDSNLQESALAPSTEQEKKLLSNFSLELESLQLSTPIRFDLNESANDVMSLLLELLSENGASNPIQCKGKATFYIRTRSSDMNFQCETVGDSTRIQLNIDDLKEIATAQGRTLNEAEIEFAKNFPLSTPIALIISEKTTLDADRLFKIDPSIPVDTYRHVLWSYRLAKYLGERQSKQLTNAHEAGAQRSPQLADRRKDLLNNSSGIRYWKLGLSEKDLLKQIKTDPLIAR